jgi:Protein of unknown function (DUF4242)
MKRYMIEREMPKIGSLQQEQLRLAALTSHQVLKEPGRTLHWQESLVTADKMFSIYLAEDEAIVREHAVLSGFPAAKITQMRTTIDPNTGG